MSKLYDIVIWKKQFSRETFCKIQSNTLNCMVSKLMRKVHKSDITRTKNKIKKIKNEETMINREETSKRISKML